MPAPTPSSQPSPQTEVAAKILAVPQQQELPLTSQPVTPSIQDNTMAPIMQQNDLSVVPDDLNFFMKSHEEIPSGLEVARQFIAPSFLKIVQASSKQELKQKFSTGDMIVTPDNVLFATTNNGNQILSESSRIPFTAIFFFVDWAVWNPVQLSKAGSVQAVRSRTSDQNSEIAKRAKSFDKSVNMQPYPEDPNNPELRLRFIEHLNFICLFNLEGWQEKPILISFFKGSYKNGSTFISTANMRKYPMFTCQFEIFSRYTTNPAGDYYALVADNPVNFPAYVSGEIAERNLALFKGFEESHKQGQIEPTYGESASGNGNVVEAKNVQQQQPQQAPQQQAPITPGVVPNQPQQLSTAEQAKGVF